MILVTIRTGHQLAPDAAASYERMSVEYGATLPVESAYRDSAQQRYLYQGWLARRPGFNFALPPGSSKHELGLAVDFRPAAFGWLEENAARHGWRRTNPGEPWHHEYLAALDVAGLAAAPPPPPPPPPPSPPPSPAPPPSPHRHREELPMRYLLQIDPRTDGRWFLVDYGAGTAQRLQNGVQLDLIRRDPNVEQVIGPQAPTVLAGLSIRGQ